ncbi:Exodeoxyribonuclease VII large subunit [Hydrocarboniphaga daqingensis]|uniref:Exodeoxyribonuclease 7 large subunit n=1 Tax=Hydrocarboniphaga daqingensis TaxID=490188 RepID=A0A1M5P6R0_9GAMM|nr:exodeoxyribonuclease VII large subunit [Hydrocarboniphaga daqingensis]SHG96913.1 Exodeoxyribonuclease VII large subunit [Hydrocarboniphaga daqingensis]
MATAQQTVYAVSELSEMLRGLVEDSLPSLWVEGEISNLARPASGHWYFTLKDSGAQLRCVMFRKANYLVRPQPRDGDQVRVRAQASVYVARGDLQLICEAMEPAGQGALLLAYERLKARLQAEGLFDAAIKRPIPPVPRAIGLITSASGAAVQDVLTALSRRFPLTTVHLLPVPVQGAEAAPAIVKALQHLPVRAPAVELILLVRGGGSLEDLWAFNEEAVARAIRACRVPVISGIGHEVDFTIADFAADLRAPTPTAAAELASPDIADWRRRIDQLGQALARLQRQAQQQSALRLQRANQRLIALHPGRRLQDRAQRLDELESRLQRALRQHLDLRRARWSALQARLLATRPQLRINQARSECLRLQTRLQQATVLQLRSRRDRLDQIEALLASFNPQAVLQRGYAIARDADGRVLMDADAVTAGTAVDLQLARGRLRLVKPAD